MRASAATAAAIAGVSLLAGAVPASAGVTAAGVTSDNVTHVRNLSQHADTSGARLVGNYFYITTGRDLTIYDVSTPENPKPVGDLRLPQVAEPTIPEEDVDTNGRILLVENGDTLSVIDVTDKSDPEVLSQVPDAAVHTITCVLDCKYAYGENGKIFDLTDPTRPTLTMSDWTKVAAVESSHDVTEVAPGIVLTASQPMYKLDVSVPGVPRIIAKGPEENGRFVHATRWPRAAQDDFLLVGGERIGPVCSDSKSATFSTWDADTFQQIDDYRVQPRTTTTAPESSFCTHWFQEHPRYENGGLVSISWYEHGTRFLRVGQDGQISEEGFYLPNGGQASAAYWISDRVVYVADYLRGLDVLRFEGDVGADAPPVAPAQPPSGSEPTTPGADKPGKKVKRRRKLSDYVYLPPMSNCIPRKGLRIGLRARPPERVRALAVYVNGKRAGYFRGKRPRRRLRVKLPKLPGMVVRVAVRTRSGKLVAGLRSYRSCGARPATIIPAGTAGSKAGNVTRYGALCYLRANQAAD